MKKTKKKWIVYSLIKAIPNTLQIKLSETINRFEYYVLFSQDPHLFFLNHGEKAS